MKLTKKLAALLLAVLLLVTAAPITMLVAAADISSGDLVWGNDQGITRAQWLHNLVVVFEMEADPDALPDNYFSDLDASHQYYEDILLAVEFGVVDVGAGYELQPDIAVTRDFAAYTLNFCLGYQLDEGETYTFSDADACVSADSAQIAVNRGWFALIGGKFAPEALITVHEIEVMLNDAADILEKEIIDPNHEDVFKFQSDVTVLEDGTEVAEDESGVVTVTNCPETIAAGDKFAAFFGGIPRGYKALTVTLNGDQTVITTEELSFQDTFVDLDIQGITDAGAMEFTPIGDAQVELIEERDPASFFAVKKIPTLSVKTKLNLGGGISVSVSAKIKDPKVEYDVTAKRAYVKLIGTTEITYEAEAEMVNEEGKSISVDLCKAGVPGVGGFKLSATFKMGGSASGTVKGTLTAGIECTYGQGIRAVKNFAQRECSSHAEASASVGLKASLGVNDMPIVTAEIFAEVGLKAKVEITSYASGTPSTCSQFAGYLYAKYGAVASLEFFNWETSFEREYDIFDDSNSPVRLVYHYENGRQVAKCTRGSQGGMSSGGFGGGGGGSWGYYTNSDSRWSGNGWSGADNSYGVNAAGESVRLFDYYLDDNGNAVINKYYGDAWTVNIPETIDGYTVVGIDNSVFKAKHLTTVNFSDTLTFIKNGAFYGCTNLREVEFPENFEILHCGAFENCRGLRRVYITKNMRAQDYCGANYMYPGPFIGCENLTTIDFEEGITRIPHALFIGCPGLQSVTIPDTVTTIHAQAFADCENLQSVSLPAALVTIENYAFSACSSLSDITLPADLKTLGCGALQYCDSLESINIPKDMNTGTYCGSNYMYPGPFTGCENLNTVTFAAGITYLPDALLSSCPGLTHITIPSTVTDIRFKVFSDSVNLESVDFSGSLVYIDRYAFSGCTGLKEAILPASLKVLGCGAFQGCTGLQRVHIPAGMDTGEHCGSNYQYPGPFNSCSALTEVTFGEGFSTMPNALFWNCTGLESIVLPNTLTNISWKCFSDCTDLKSITIPESVTTISDNAFHSCGLEEISIPNSVTSIGSRAFQLSKLQSVLIPDSVTYTGDHILADCPDLKEIIWSASVDTIKDYSFAGSVSVETVHLANTVKYLHKGIFRDCDSLKTVVLPDSILTIGNELFYGCDALEQVTIPNSVTSIGASGFEKCPVLKSVTLSYKLKNIPGAMFRDCAELEEVFVPNLVTSIGDNAFANSPMLAKVYLPRSLTSISGSAFSYKDITTLYGVPGTYAQTWASENGYQFASHVVSATDVQLNKTALTLNRGQTENLLLTFAPLNMNDAITFTSADTSIATVSTDGQVKGVKVGSTTVTVTVGDTSLTCSVTVQQPVTSISLSDTSVTLYAQETCQLTATAYPSNAGNRTVTWTTSDASVATVSQDGLVTALKQGTATITATANDGSGKQASCTVTVAYSGWIKENGQWYYYQGSEKVTGWQKISGTYYYFNGSGVMQTGWLKSGNTWYYLQSSGAMATGWLQLGNTWYYLNSSGAMVTGTTVIGGKLHNFNASGVWLGGVTQSGWVSASGNWYYCQSGTVTTGWKNISGTYYYFNGSGIMQTGWLKSGNTWYYLQSSGAMATGWCKIGSTYYYFASSGSMQTGWLKSGNTWYYLQSSGAMATGWQKIGSTWYYFQSGGAMQTGWLKLGNTWYYFHGSGAMATGSLKIGAKTYNFNSSGACLNP